MTSKQGSGKRGSERQGPGKQGSGKKTDKIAKVRSSARTADLVATRTATSKNQTVEMVRQLAKILDTHNLSELVLDSELASVTLRRGQLVSAPAIVATPTVAAHAPAPAPAAAAPEAAAAPAAPTLDDLHVVTSPFVGTFYRAPNPDSAPYVNVGDRVDRGTVLCIVEAMKLMNEIEADKAGEIAAILVENGDAVEYGQPLFKIAP